MDSDVLHMIRLSAEVAADRITHWFQYAVEEYPVECFTHRTLAYSEMSQGLRPLFSELNMD